MLDTELKKFIEDNIDIIENGGIQTVLTNCPYYLITDLIDILDNAKIDTKRLKDAYIALDSKLSNSKKLARLTTGLIFVPLTKSEILDFDIYPYNPFTRPRYYSLDTGMGQQVVFAMELTTGNIYVEEDTDKVGVKTEYNSPLEFVKDYINHVK